MRSLLFLPFLLFALALPASGPAPPGSNSATLSFPTGPARIAGIFLPGGKARILVTFPRENLTRVLDQRGRVLRTFTEVRRPLGIAAGGGKIYIGSASEGSVQVFDYKGRLIGSLGAGAGEFERPTAIALHPADGRIHVADIRKKEVRVYDPGSRQLLGTLGAAELASPSGMAFASDGTLLVADMNPGVVKKFGADGAYAGDFNFQGNDPGETMRAMGVALDLRGRVYVTDAFHGGVLAFEGDGTFIGKLGAIGDGPGRLLTPIETLILPGNGMLVVTDNGGRQLEVLPALP